MSGIIAAAGIGVAGSLAASQLSKGGSANAAGMSEQAGREANLFAQNQRNVNRSDASPWVSLGRNSTDTIGALLGYGNLRGDGTEGGTYEFNYDPAAYDNALWAAKRYAGSSGATMPVYKAYDFNPLTTVSENFTADPSYNWRVSEGNKALDRTASAKGMGLSGAQYKAATDYNSNVASQEYGNWYQRWLAQNDFNTRYGLATNAQNFNQQQTRYQNEYGQFRDAIGDLYRSAGLGAQAQSNTASVNSGLTTSGNNALVSGGNAAARYTADGGNALASGLSSVADTAGTLAGYYFGNNSSGGYKLPDAARAQLPPYSGLA